MNMPMPTSASTKMQIRQTAQGYAEQLSGVDPSPAELTTILQFAEKFQVAQSSLLHALLYRTEGQNLARVFDLALQYNPSLVTELASQIKPAQAKTLPPEALSVWRQNHGFLGNSLSNTVTSLSQFPTKPKTPVR